MKPNSEYKDEYVHHISPKQLTSYISLSLSWSLASPPNRRASTTIYGIQNSKTLVQSVTIFTTTQLATRR